MNPYEVLGVSEDADEETIKKAYRELVKKYHPDKYVNNPLADLAGEKLKEINKAYDMIMNKNTQSAPAGASPYGTGGTSGAASFQTVRVLISQSRIREAAAMLESLPRTAEWYYLSGRVRMQVGWYDQAISFLQTAVNMDPNNVEYRDALENIKNRTRTYTTQTPHSVNGGCCDSLGCCTACMLADCICPCF
ncbi:MAG: J domain-containing protein [Firmicutes bacterium]|nr:J domain-containing protein [Bacillota bacterium]